MKVTVEISVPVDDKRNVWMTAYAEDVEADDVSKAAAGCAEALTDQALAAWSVVAPRPAIDPRAAEIVAAAKRDEVPASQRPKRPDDPDTMRAFGDDADQ
jgi:hypothetical protein